MSPRLPARIDPPILFAHRGGRAAGPENRLETFERALEAGATGLESDVWLTRDGVPVLDHDGIVRRGLRRHRVGNLAAADVAPPLVTLAELYDRAGDGYELSLDLKDPDAVGVAEAVVELARKRGGGAPSRLWLCHPDTATLVQLRARVGSARLVSSTRLRRMRDGPERHAAELADAGIEAVNLPHDDWTGGLTTLFHRFQRFVFAWDAQHERILDALFDMGIDAVYSDHVDRMVAAASRSAGP